LSDEKVKEALAPFARLVIDGSDRKNMQALGHFKAFGVRGLPTLIFLNGAGEQVAKLEGQQSEAAIIAAARTANAQ
jgi:hypothetical protein